MEERVIQTNSALFSLRLDPRLVLDCLAPALHKFRLYFSPWTFPGTSESPLELFTSTLRDFLQGLELNSPKTRNLLHLHLATGPGPHCPQPCSAITFQDFLGPQALSMDCEFCHQPSSSSKPLSERKCEEYDLVVPRVDSRTPVQKGGALWESVQGLRSQSRTFLPMKKGWHYPGAGRGTEFWSQGLYCSAERVRPGRPGTTQGTKHFPLAHNQASPEWADTSKA